MLPNERETIKSYLAGNATQKKPVGVACRPAFRFLGEPFGNLQDKL